MTSVIIQRNNHRFHPRSAIFFKSKQCGPHIDVIIKKNAEYFAKYGLTLLLAAVLVNEHSGQNSNKEKRKKEESFVWKVNWHLDLVCLHLSSE